MGSVYTSSEIQRALGSVREFILEGLSNVNGVHVRRGAVESPVQYFFNRRPDTPLAAKLYEVVLTHSVASEKSGPGSFLDCMALVAKGLKTDAREFRSLVESSARSLVSRSRFATEGDVESFFTDLDLRPQLSSALQSAITMAGFKGRVVLEKTDTSTVSVERVSGYTFDLDTAFPVSLVLTAPRVLCIDGFVESVSEIHHLLEASHHSGEPMLLFLRGLHQDVTNTLKVNLDNGRLQIVPILVKFDVEGLNTLNDICMVSGGDIVSSLKGQLISSVDYTQVPRVDRATVVRNRTSLSCSRTRSAVQAHVQEILERRRTCGVEDVEKLYDVRLHALSPNHVVVRLPSSVDFVVVQQSLDIVLRSLRSSMEHGVVDVEGRVRPTDSAVAPYLSALKCLETVWDLGGVVVT